MAQNHSPKYYRKSGFVKYWSSARDKWMTAYHVGEIENHEFSAMSPEHIKRIRDFLHEANFPQKKSRS